MIPIRTAAAGLLLFGAAAASGGEPALPEPAPPLRAGATGVALTVVEGDEIREIPVKYIGVYNDFGGPGFDVHLVELAGPDAEAVGIANGMSGSPVYIEGRLIGALSYRLGALPKRPIAGVTPLPAMREAARAGGSFPGARTQSGLEPIGTPVLATGIADEVRRWLGSELEPLGFALAPGGRGAGAGDEPAPALRPGSPVGVELVRGDMTIAATGTVTFLEGDTVFAFGHPFLGSGRVEMPMVSARVLHTLGDMAGSFRLTNVGGEVGAIVEDRLGAVVGRIGQKARMIPVDVRLHGADYGEQAFHYETIRHDRLSPLLGGAVVASSLRTAGYSQEATLLARGRVRLEGLPDVPLEMAFSTSAGTDPTLMLATEIQFTVASLARNSRAELAIAGIELEIDASRDAVSYTIEDVQYDRGTLVPGAPLHIRCLLRRYRGGTEVREIELRLPPNLPDRGGLVLVVGNPMLVDQALGRPLIERLKSATDVESLVQVLGESRSSNRLTAVVYRPGRAVVSRGTAYSALPPTAEHLLGTQARSSGAPGGPLASPIARAEIALDGPVRAGARLGLRVDRKDDGGGED